MLVTVYGKEKCIDCLKTKAYLESFHIDYDYIDVLEDGTALSELKKYGFGSLPVVKLGTLDNAWSGFNEDRLNELRDIVR